MPFRTRGSGLGGIFLGIYYYYFVYKREMSEKLSESFLLTDSKYYFS